MELATINKKWLFHLFCQKKTLIQKSFFDIRKSTKLGGFMNTEEGMSILEYPKDMGFNIKK
jgi:hypothetical protein